jgi:two-component system cell cycle sensor histidine kinase/response regulator CckA
LPWPPATKINNSFTDSAIVVTMDAIPSLSLDQQRLAPGIWRWIASIFGGLACAAAIFALAEPRAAGTSGLLLLAGIVVVGAIFLIAMWPRDKAAAGLRRVAEAATASHVPWAITGPDGPLIGCNDAYRRLTGTPSGEAAPPPELAITSEAASAALYRLAHAVRDKRELEETVPLSPETEAQISVRSLRGGESVWWFTPLATRERAEEKVNPQARLVESLDEAPVGVASIGSDGRVAECNKAFAAFFSPHPVSGRSLAELADHADRQNVERMLSGSASREAPIEIRPFGRPECMAELYASPGGDKLTTIYLIDVSEQKALETKFAQSQKMQAVGQLAGGVAHDFNNLLTVIIGNSEFLLMRHQAGDPSFREINDVHQNAIRAANLVRQLLAFSRQQTMQPRVLDLSVVIGELGEMLRRLLREGISLKLEQAQNLWPVHADEAQVTNALINLVVNARDALPKGGTVTIRTSNETVTEPTVIGSAQMAPGDYVRVDVSDTGIGIPQDYLVKIFDPFFTTKPVGEGTGLGLATVYGIVKQTGGFITVDSEVGKGTGFSIFLPRFAGEAESKVDVSLPRDITGEETILLVEDEDAVRSFAARALRQRGYQVLEAPGGEQALEIVKARAAGIDLVVTDVVMPNMDGPTLVRAVKRLKPDMQVIFMSGYAEEAFRRNDEKAEALHFLPKPFGLKQLAAKVKDVLSSTPAQ